TRQLATDRRCDVLLEEPFQARWSEFSIDTDPERRHLRNVEIEEIKERKLRYEEAYVKWNTHQYEDLIRVRDILETKEYTFLEETMEKKLTKIMREIDDCLTRAYDARKSGGNSETILMECGMKRLLAKNRECGYVLMTNCGELSACHLSGLDLGRSNQ